MGGVIGAVVGVAIVIAALVAWLIVRRRKRAKRDAARKEEPTFVDLDGDEDGQDGAAAMAAARRRRASGGVSQTYQVSPFTYTSAPQSSSPDLGNGPAYADEPFSNGSSTRPGSMAGFPPGSPVQTSSNLRYPPRPQSSSGYTDARSGAGYTQGSEADFASAGSHAFGPGSVAGGSYRLSARNGEATAAPPVPALPTKGPLPGEEAAAGSSQRFVQHSDAGPVQSVAVEDQVEEVSSLARGYADVCASTDRVLLTNAVATVISARLVEQRHRCWSIALKASSPIPTRASHSTPLPSPSHTPLRPTHLARFSICIASYVPLYFITHALTRSCTLLSTLGHARAVAVSARCTNEHGRASAGGALSYARTHTLLLAYLLYIDRPALT